MVQRERHGVHHRRSAGRQAPANLAKRRKILSEEIFKTRMISTRVVIDMESMQVIERDSYEYSGPVELAAPPGNIQSIALQLEKVRKNVPTAYEQEHILLDMIDKRGDVIDASTRNIRLPILMRPGGKFSQGTADFDDMGRGSGSTWDVGTLSTLHFRFAFEVSKLAEYATKGNDHAVEDVALRQVADAMKMFMPGADCAYQS